MLADIYQLCSESALLCWLFLSPPHPRGQSLSFRTYSELTLVIDLEWGAENPCTAPTSVKPSQSPGQRKLTYWDKEELAELWRKKGQYQHLSTHSSPGKCHGLFFPLSGPRFWHQKSTGIVYLVFFFCGFATLSSEPDFSTLFFEAAGGNPQHCISGHLLSEHVFNWQLSAWRSSHLSEVPAEAILLRYPDVEQEFLHLPGQCHEPGPPSQ